jgi:hypothetical protein
MTSFGKAFADVRKTLDCGHARAFAGRSLSCADRTEARAGPEDPLGVSLGALADAVNERDEFVAPVALVAREFDQVPGLVDERGVVWRAGDPDRAAASHLQSSFVSEEPQGAEDGVLVDAEDGGEVAGLGDAVAGPGFALLDRASDRSSDLLVQRSRVSAVDRVDRDRLLGVVDTIHETINTSFNGD